MDQRTLSPDLPMNSEFYQGSTASVRGEAYAYHGESFNTPKILPRKDQALHAMWVMAVFGGESL